MSKEARKIIEEIKHAPICKEEYTDYTTIICISFRGIKYYGYAVCHQEDAEYYSKYIGATLAHYRAMYNALYAEVADAKLEYNIFKHHYHCIIQNQNIEEVDPTKRLTREYFKLENKYNELRFALKVLKQEMKNYSINMTKSFEFMDKKRTIAEVENNN